MTNSLANRKEKNNKNAKNGLRNLDKREDSQWIMS